ncbi:hypothetical protein HMPREF0556_10226 [Listeria grayi DSM 20601]|uniref:Uncharacterized protein n=1 Tax=Listeria grayi DSM 20601 TaxID=525367 RepID=D7UUV1_LISGR|nr:hypothetical protein HMPREF0556_10226 [Listeria grayi DSM 20601]
MVPISCKSQTKRYLTYQTIIEIIKDKLKSKPERMLGEKNGILF